MRWILCGKNDAAVAALEHLVEQGDEVLAVGVRGDDGRDGWQRSFAGAAARLGLRFEQPRRINAPKTAKGLAAFGARALISIQYDQILRGPLFREIGCPCLNLHFSLLPRHRGVAPIAWAILSGDDEAGVTLHHMVEDIDAGDLIAQRRVRIGPEDTARELYDEVSVAAGALFRASHPFADDLLASRLPQDAAGAVYHKAGDLDFARRDVEWARPAAELQRWLRAMIFPPMQHPITQRKGEPLEIRRVGAVRPAVDAPPGCVVEVSKAGARVACGLGSLLLLEPADALRVGDRLE